MISSNTRQLLLFYTADIWIFTTTQHGKIKLQFDTSISFLPQTINDGDDWLPSEEGCFWIFDFHHCIYFGRTVK